jgi:hypothetical protein
MSPFTPIGDGKFRSPSGKIMTAKQVQAYYAKSGTRRIGPKKRGKK